MLTLQVQITRFVDDAQPGWVECRLVDAAGAVHLFVEKGPVVCAHPLDRRSDYPQSGGIACTRVDRAGLTRVVVDTESPWGVASIAGEHRFTVRAEQVTAGPDTDPGGHPNPG